MELGEYDVTIAILTRNGGTVLKRAIEAIAAQQTQRRVELLAIDSGSDDAALQWLRNHNVRVLSIPPDDFDFGLTRGLAFQEARGNVVVNLSQDAVPAHALWLEHLLAPLDAADVGASCGTSIPDPHRPMRQFAWERNGYFYFTAEMKRFTRRYGRGLSFANSAVPKAVWRKCRFESAVLGEDFQLQRKLAALDLRVAFPEAAQVWHHHDYSVAELLRRCRDEGHALHHLGCPYPARDLLRDLASIPKYTQWLREFQRGALLSPAEFLFPVLRPAAVYAGSRAARRKDPQPPVPEIEVKAHD